MPTAPDPNYMPASGNLMDLLEDEAWHRKAIEAENLIEGDIVAGVPGRRGWMMTWPRLEVYAHYRQVRSLVLRGFATLIREGNLGVGQEAAIACGKPLVFERMMAASVEVQAQVLALIDWNYIGPRTELTPERMAVLQVVLREVMTEADWRAIAAAAANQVQQHVMSLRDIEANLASKA